VRWPWPDAVDLRVPVFLHDVAALAALFTADARAVRALLPDARLRAVEVAPGRSLFQLLAVDYRRSDLGSYGEIACTVPVAIAEPGRPTGALAALAPVADAFARGLARSFTAWIWRMPVTTAQARDAGIALAGFPKSLADVRFASEEGRPVATLRDEDHAMVLRLALPQAAAQPAREGVRDLRLRSITSLRGQPVSSLLRVRVTAWRDLARPAAPVLELGRGELAEALRGLGLSERALFAHHAQRAHAVLFPPRNLVDD
jgi:hypothetical protein